jgi:ABC-type microcin C transport system permease subunit YejB
MFRYFVQRLLVMIPTLIVISMAIFAIIQAPPGDWIETYIAELYLADLRGADLSRAQNLVQEQLVETCGDEATKLPAGLAVPPEWPCASQDEE